MYKVYGDYNSGNCYKVKLMLNLLGSEYEWVPVDILNGETQTPAFLEKNPNGKIPVLELEDGTCLWESNAILNFLADGSSYLPSEPRLRTQVLQWQFFEQYSHEPSVAVARFIQFYLGLPAERMTEYRAMQKAGYRALAVMEQQLDRTPFLVGENFPSPTLPCMPTPTSRIRAVSIWHPIPGSAVGWIGSRRSRVISVCWTDTSVM